MGGFGPIDYDLARYVLCDPIDRMFFSNRGSDSDKTAEDIDYTCYFSEKEIEEILTNEEIFLTEKCREKLRESQLTYKKQRRIWEYLDDLIDDDADTTIPNLKSPAYKYNKEADSFLLEHAYFGNGIT